MMSHTIEKWATHCDTFQNSVNGNQQYNAFAYNEMHIINGFYALLIQTKEGDLEFVATATSYSNAIPHLKCAIESRE